MCSPRQRSCRAQSKLVGWSLVWIVFGWLAAGPSAATWTGRPLQEALQELQEQGLELIFTTQIVRPELRVTVEPQGADPRAVLDELLAPHGLVAQEAPGGVLIIVPSGTAPQQDASTEIHGQVLAKDSRQALGDVTVRLDGTDRLTHTDPQGRFQLPVDAGSHRLMLHRSDHLPAESLVEVQHGEVSELIVELIPTPTVRERIEVTSHRLRLVGDQLSTLALGNDELAGLPRIAEDPLRMMKHLPGASGNDLSAQISVRGGRQDEVLVIVDGLEIVEPYHLKDFGNALSVLAPGTIGDVELSTGGFSALYGDRMSGVLEMHTVEPKWKRRTELGWSLLDAHALGSGTWRQERGQWLAALRGGLLEIPLDITEHADEVVSPRFADVLAKGDVDLGAHNLRGQVLAARDKLDVFDEEEARRFASSDENLYGWLTHQGILGSRLAVTSRASWSHIERDRQGSQATDERRFTLRDQRSVDLLSVAQHWSRRWGTHSELLWGFTFRGLDATYDYQNERQLLAPLAALRTLPATGTTAFDERFRGHQWGLYGSGRWHKDALTVELGLRFDASSILDDNHHLSPRLSLSYTLDARQRLRLAWGLFHQTQRLYELQVEDGVTDFVRAERAEHRILGYERTFTGVGETPLVLRAELYDRRVARPRARFENLFEPISLTPELADDRVLITPERSRARGLELFLSGRAGKHLDWLASYTYARTVDRVGDRDVPRSLDQPHTLRLAVDWLLPKGWRLNLSGELHTGWPTTSLTVRTETNADGDVEILPVLGPLGDERLPDYRRLDFRLSRELETRRGELTFFIAARNLTRQGNVRGFDISIESDEDGQIMIDRQAKLWGLIVPNFGFNWRF